MSIDKWLDPEDPEEDETTDAEYERAIDRITRRKIEELENPYLDEIEIPDFVKTTEANPDELP